MKFYKIILFCSAIAISITSCKKIEYKPEGSVDASEAITKESDLAATINAAYAPLAGNDFYGGRLQKISEYLADQADGTSITGFEADIVNYKSSPNSGTKEIMKEPYVVIQRANKTLENLSYASNQANRDNYAGQAKFLRAISHFELVRLFAQPYGYTSANTHLGIILKTSSDFETGKIRNTVAEVYDLVLSDLRDAQNLLPASNGVYPTKWAAKAYLAKVFFQMNKFDSAYKYSNEVITGSTAVFDVSTAYFSKRFNNPVSTESLFHLVNDAAPASIRYNTLRNLGATTLSLNLPVKASIYTMGTSNTNDIRKVMYTVNPIGYGIDKYKASVINLTLVHITEMKLIRAESASELGTNLPVAVGDINDITNRAYAGTTTPLLTTASAAAIKARVRLERRLEMIYENGDRLQEIKRIGAKGEPSFSHGGAPWNCDGMILQFPAVEVSINVNFVPNPTGTCI
jgi:starch-binding outer membrane protein, SusD/RagB family